MARYTPESIVITSVEQPNLLLDQKLKEFMIESLPKELQSFAQEGSLRGHFGLAELSNPGYLSAKKALLQTAIHEAGHDVIATKLGFITTLATIEPNGNILGMVRTVPKEQMPFNEEALKRIIICCGSWAAEADNGISDHSGTGSDMDTARYLSGLISGFDEHGSQRILRKQFSNANKMAQNHRNDIIQRAWLLLKHGTLV